MRLITLLGGTFDPVHNGHLRIGLEIQQYLAADELRFVPCADPPHKSAANADMIQRSEMLSLAIQEMDGCSIDSREFDRRGPSYTIDTLRSIRDEVGENVSLCWVVGSDSFQSLDTWHEWEHLFDYAHFVVACRPGWQKDVNSKMGQMLVERIIDEPVKLQQKQAGYIMPCPVTQLSISATAIRDMVSRGSSPRFLVPDTVAQYIETHKLYRQ